VALSKSNIELCFTSYFGDSTFASVFEEEKHREAVVQLLSKRDL